jgi:hypothetical protein
MIGQSNDMLPIKKGQKMHPQLINMNLQKGIIIKGHIVKLSLKLGKHNTRTPSLVINNVIFFLKTQTKYINIQS